MGDGSTTTGTLDRNGLSVPTGDATHLRTDYAYDDNGRVKDVTDPRGKVARTLYDVAGRKVASIANYVNGTPSGVTGDDDIYTRYDYNKGLQVAMWVDLDGDGVKDAGPPADQVTQYLYGVSKTASNTPSKVSSNRLLRAVIYPDSTNASATVSGIDAGSGGDADLVSFAYNAQGQEILKKDEAINVLEKVYDTGGRLRGGDGRSRRSAHTSNTLSHG